MKVSITKQIDRPVEEVFHAFTDLENAPKRVSGIKSLEILTDGPVGVGTRFRETRVMFKRDATEEMTITAFERNKGYRVDAHSCGCEYVTEFRFVAEGSGTRVEVDMTTRPISFFAKLMSPLGRLMAGSMIRLFERDLDDLKRHAEMAAMA